MPLNQNRIEMFGLLVAVLLLMLGACDKQLGDKNWTAKRIPGLSKQWQSTVDAETNRGAKVELLLQLAETYYYKESSLSLAIAKAIENLTKDTKYRSAYAKALYWKSRISIEQSPLDVNQQKIWIDAKIGADIFRSKRELHWLARTLSLQALILYNRYEEHEGWNYSNQALKIMQEVDESNFWCSDWGDLFRIRGNILLYTTGHLDSVLHNYQEAHQAYQNCKDTLFTARVLANMAIIQERKKNFRLADSLMSVSIAQYDSYGNTEQLSKAYLDFATFYANRFLDSNDPSWLMESNRILDFIQGQGLVANSEIWYQRGANYHNFALFSEDAQSPYWDSINLSYQLAIEACQIEGNMHYLEWIQKQIAKICCEIGTYRCSDLLAKGNTVQQYLSQKTKASFEDSAIKQEEHSLREQRRRVRYWITLLGVGVLLIFAALVMKHQRSKVLLLKKQLENRMATLRAQMNPHFISNSLNAIDSLVMKGKKELASEYLIDFSNLCRLILDNSNSDLISLQEELETLGYYLSLEQLRMGNRMTYTIEVDNFIQEDQVYVPPMLLQPFIENAIIHGLQNKQAPGQIQISIQQVSKTLKITIQDDGVGRQKALELRAKSVLERPSMGITITEERLQHLHKVKGANIIYQDLYDETGQANGTKVSITFPIITKLP